MMDKLEALAATHRWAAAEWVTWAWVAGLDADTRRTVELALGMHGIDGLGALLLRGPALGSLDAAQLGELEAAVEAELGRELLAA